MRQLRLAFLAAFLSHWLNITAEAKPYCRIEAEQITLGNEALKHEWRRRGNVWGPSRIVRADGHGAVLFTDSEEFVLKLWEGPTLAASTFRAETPQIIRAPARPECLSLLFRYVEASLGLQVDVQYWLTGDRGLLRKAVTVAAPAGQIMDELDVEHLVTETPATRGGYGQPIFLGDIWFLGLEYPAGYNDIRQEAPTPLRGTTAEGKVPPRSRYVLRLHHFPGRETGPRGLTSKTAILGVTPPGVTREIAFSDYLDSVRIAPRNFLQYNSWYDLRGAELTIPNLLERFAQFKRHLLEPYGLKMDAFVPDDGWQDPNSIWQPDAQRYPQGFRPLAEALERAGSHLGLWMPLNGTNLNVEWGKARGFEVSDRGAFYCLAAPRYNAEIRRVTAERIRDGRLAYYKHDFNTLQCSAAGHGHLPTPRHGHEASLDAELELLAWERQINPRIFLNVTSSVWLSPWWLQHADSIWMCASDFGYEKTYPQLSPREWDMSYRDAHFYRVYRTEHNLVPLSALMTHGIIHGRHCRLGGEQETVREFSDMTVLYYGRGVQLKELYITPELMDEARWRVLGWATRWAGEKQAVLRQTVMIGGDPRRGQIYGYVHWARHSQEGLIVLRNPAPGAETIEIPFDQSVFYRGARGKLFAARVIYPVRETQTVRWISGERKRWLVPGCSVVVIAIKPEQTRHSAAIRTPAGQGRLQNKTPLVQELTTELLSDTPGATLHFRLPAEQMLRCDLLLILRGSSQMDFSGVMINGQLATMRKAEGPGWKMRACDLRPFAGQALRVTFRLPPAEERPFAVTQVPVEAWLIADRPTGEPTQAADLRLGEGPWPIAQGYQRESQRLLNRTIVTGAGQARHVTEEELRQLRAAKLRLEVFDVNREPQYADKWIILNGQRLARVPANTGELSTWEEKIVDFKPEQLVWLQRTNRIVLSNAGGDCYKFRGVSLALQLPDGRWIYTAPHEAVYSSVKNWLYAEGEMFVGEVSPEIKIVIP